MRLCNCAIVQLCDCADSAIVQIVKIVVHRSYFEFIAQSMTLQLLVNDNFNASYNIFIDHNVVAKLH